MLYAASIVAETGSDFTHYCGKKGGTEIDHASNFHSDQET
jgi:hypothetical protein